MKLRATTSAAIACAFALFGFASAVAFGQESAGERAVDPKASKALFEVGHLYLTKVDGTIPILSGTVTLAPDSATPKAVAATLDPKGVRTAEDERDDDLQAPDWFDTKRFPTWTYVSTGVSPGPGGHLTVTGLLTVHGTAEPVTLDVTIVRGLPNPLYHAVGHADRHGFNMTVTRTDALVGNDITIVLDIALRP